MTASRMTPLTAPRTKMDWSPMGVMTELRRQSRGDARQQARTPLTTSSVEAVPVLRTVTQHAAVAVLADDVGLRREAVADGGDVVEIDGRAVDLLDGQLLIPARVKGVQLMSDVVLDAGRSWRCRRAGRRSAAPSR